MQFVKTETEQQRVNVFLNILEILMLLAGLSVWSTQTVHLIKHVRGTSALIRALEHVALMHCVE